MVEKEAHLRALLLAGRAGDRHAAERFLKELTPLLRAFIRRQMAKGEWATADAEDVLQETLIALHTRSGTYDAAMPLTAWVHAIARYRLIDAWRMRRRHAGHLDIDNAEHLLAADDHQAGEASRDLSALLANLPARTRRLIEATKLEGRSVAEAARETDVTESAAKVAIHRGLKRLGELVGLRGAG